MKCILGKAYFSDVKDKIKQYPYLDRDLDCDILIIGGGIDGAILNFYLSQKYNAVLVDASRFGMSCTSVATALLEYQLDDYAQYLKDFMSEEDIVKVYKMGLESIEMMSEFISKYGNHSHFKKTPSLMYTDSILGMKALKEEHLFRLKHNFKSVLYTEENNPYPFKFKLGLYNEDGGAEVNPYLFTKQMIEKAVNQKQIYENTRIDTLTYNNDRFEVITTFGNKIMCNKVILATGFDFSLMNEKDLCERVISYSIVTKEIEGIDWEKSTRIQDDKEPYHYLRVLPDNRLIYGGEDSPYKVETIDNSLAEKKYNKLKNDLIKMFPHLETQIEIDYEFCGVFGSTKNNLGLIGQTENPNLYYFLSAGANGIINAMSESKLIIDLLEGKENDLEDLFSPLREN